MAAAVEAPVEPVGEEELVERWKELEELEEPLPQAVAPEGLVEERQPEVVVEEQVEERLRVVFAEPVEQRWQVVEQPQVFVGE